MSEIPSAEDIVTINGKQYSRLMAEEMARDIELAHSLRPGVWAIGDNSSLIVGQIAVLSFRIPIQHGYLIDIRAAPPESLSLIESHGREARFKDIDHYRYVHIPFQDLKRHLELLRPAHEAVVTQQASAFFQRSQRWKWHNFNVAEVLNEVVGIDLPAPAYADELRILRKQERDAPSTSTRYWKVSPGGAGRYWKDFQDRSVVAVHWSETLDDLSQYPEDKEAFVNQARKQLEVSLEGAKSLWTFSKVMRSGDQILAYANQTVVGYGEITGDYHLVDDEFEYMHRRDVTWESVTTRPIGDLSPQLQRKLRQQATLFELTREEFLEAIGKQPRLESSPANPFHDPDKIIRDSFAASGLHYTESQIAAFYTALQTKGFVVLSGISGTGKSKIATGFVQMLPKPQSEQAWTLPEGDDRITIQVKPYMLKHRNVTFPSKYLDRFPDFSHQSSITVVVRIGNETGTGNLRYELRNGARSVTLWFHKSLYAAIESQQLNANLVVDLSYNDDQTVNTINFIPIEEAGDVSVLDSDQSNHLFLAVRPDWRDSTSLLGYYNPLTKNYEWTDFLKFIIRAGENYDGPEEDRIAWFVILDEMNVAHVEYYFADLLSVIESGRDEKGWTAEPLRLTYPDALEDEAPPRELFLPPNLYIIGTVNMDETTHAFSPKVLDRAFTIELTDVDFRDYPPSGAAMGGEGLDDTTQAAMLAAFSRGGKFARIDKAEIAAFIERNPVVRDRLQALNDVLRPFRMHFGYRVFDEVTQYLANNEQNAMATFDEAFDQAVFMKVLPKFSGSRARLLSPLHGVFAWAIDPDQTSRDAVENATKLLMLYERGEATEAWEMEPAFPRVAERVRDMLVALERDGFVSFG